MLKVSFENKDLDNNEAIAFIIGDNLKMDSETLLTDQKYHGLISKTIKDERILDVFVRTGTFNNNWCLKIERYIFLERYNFSKYILKTNWVILYLFSTLIKDPKIFEKYSRK